MTSREIASREIENIYPLSPSQRGIYFEALGLQQQGLHIEQAAITLRGELDAARLVQAWQAVVDRQPMLRTGFAGRDLDRPMQVVYRQVKAETALHDLTAEPDPAAAAEALLAGDRAAGFTLARPPLIRLALSRLGPRQHLLSWTHHHILMDGWCISLLMRDLFAAYQAPGAQTAPAPAFRDYIRWLRQQDPEDARAFWRARLQGFRKPTLLGQPAETRAYPGTPADRGTPGTVADPVTPADPGGDRNGRHVLRMDADCAAALAAVARRQRVTQGAVVQAAWAVLLGHYGGTNDVVFGVTVAGRPPELDGIEEMVGMFATALPLRVALDPTEPAAALLERLHRLKQEQQPYEAFGGGQIHECSELPGSWPLYESLVTFENYPVDPAAFGDAGVEAELASGRSLGANTRHALVLLVTPGRDLELELVFGRRRFDDTDAPRILQNVAALLRAIAADPTIPLSALWAALPAAGIPRVRPAPWQVAETALLPPEARPRTRLEAQVEQIFAAVLGIPAPGLHRNFFDCGGHSLLATRAVAKLSEGLGRKLPLRLLFDNPTVAGLAAVLENDAEAVSSTMPQAAIPPMPQAAIPPVPRDRPIPLTPGQEQLWFLDRLGEGRSAYCEQGAVHLSGALDAAVLERCLAELARRHDALRTTFTEVNGRPMQLVGEAVALPFGIVDLTGRHPDSQQAEIHSAARSLAAQPFDLQHGPLFRVTLFLLGPEEQVLLQSIHHIITDGWSHSILFRELGVLYEAFSTAQPSPLKPPPIQFGDYAAWQRQRLDSPAALPALTRRAERLHGAPPLSGLPTDRPRPAASSREGACVSLTLPRTQRDGLRQLGAEAGGTLFMTLLAGFTALLYRHSGQDDLLVGMPIAGREQSELEDVFGFFVNTLVIRTDLSGNPSFRDLLARVREETLDAFASPEVPFERLVEAVRPERSPGVNPLFQVFVNMLSHPPVDVVLRGLQVAEFPLPRGASMFDVTLYLIDQRDGLRFDLVYDPALFAEARTQALLTQFEALLTAVAADPDVRIDACALTSGPPRLPQPLPRADDAESTPLALFEKAARRTPDRTALTGRDGPVGFAELDAAAAGLAALLRDGGVRHGDTVAIYGHRSAALVQALLGVHKAGAAFAILDPAYPAARLLACLRQMQPAAWIALELAGAPPPALAAAVAALPCRIILPPIGGIAPGSGGIALRMHPETTESIDGSTPTSPVMPTKVGIHEFPSGTQESHGWRAFARHDGVGIDRTALGATIPGRSLSTGSIAPGAGERRLHSDAPGPDDPAYIAFTSGTTGAPRGLRGTHRPVAHFLDWYARRFNLAADDRFALLSGLAHDPLLRDVFAPLAVGATLCIPDPGDLDSPERLLRWLADNAVSVVHLTPALAQALYATGAGPALPRLRLACFGGAALPAALVRRLRRLAPNAVCVNCYGATETPQVAACHEIGDEPGGNGAVLPIGRGIDGVELLVLDGGGHPAAPFEVGEICVRSRYLARALDANDRDADGFGPDPFGSDSDIRLYRTGDLGRIRLDGVVEFLGRRDRQVKIRGFRVELAEIEQCLLEHPAVRQAAVAVRGDSDAAPVAYWVGDPATPEELRNFLAGRLPSFMVPAGFVRLDAMPRTPNGKLDLHALPEPQAAAPAQREQPRDEVEHALCGHFAAVLGCNAVGIDDDFFACGGHSLRAMQLVSRIHRDLGVALPLRLVFVLRTVAGLAAAVREHAPGEFVPVAPAGSAQGSLLSYAERRLWLLDRLEEGASAAYIMSDVLLLEGVPDPARIEAAFQAVVRRHESLRTRFEAVDGVPRRVVRIDLDFRCPIIDLSGEADPRQRARELADADARTGFVLAEGPLLRVTLLLLGPAEHVLLFCIHHIVSDWWSTGVLIRDFLSAYALAEGGAPVELPPLRIQYRDYAAWQADRVASGALDADRRYWLDKLAGDPAPLDLPTDFPRSVARAHRGAMRQVRFDGAVPALAALGERHGASLFMVLVALAKVLFHRLTGQEEIVLGVPVAGRNHVDLEDQVGCFINMLVLRDRIAGDWSFAAVIEAVRRSATEALDHQAYPFDLLVEDLKARREPGRSPLFDVALMLQQGDKPDLSLPGLRIAPFGQAHDSAKYDMRMVFEQAGDDLDLDLEYDTSLFTHARIERLADQLRTLAAAAVRDPGCRIGALDLLPAAERQLVTEAFAFTETFASTSPSAPTPLQTSAPPVSSAPPFAPASPSPRPAAGDPSVHTPSMHSLVETQAARTPTAEAVCDAGGSVTYRELTARSDRLAARLRSLGVGPEVVVAQYLPRSIVQVVGLLAILKAGGVYLPLEVSDPLERTARLLDDSGAPVVLTMQALEGGLPSHGGQVLCLDDPEAAGAEAEATAAPEAAAAAAPEAAVAPGAGAVRPNATPAPTPVPPDAAAYLIYTSGSTGAPKGAVLAHRGFVTMIAAQIRAFAITPADRVLQFASLGFDASLSEIFMALGAGACLVVPPDAARTDPTALRHFLREEHISVATLPPALLRQMGTAGPGPLRLLVTAGEAAPVAEVTAAARGMTVWNAYGPTEASVCATMQPVEAGADYAGPDYAAGVPIGRPIEGVELLILRGDEPVPIGVDGEICLGGAVLARGYLGQPGLTAQQFVPHPWRAGRRLYRTGDIGRWRADGAVDYVGRLNHEVKVRGHRVAPGEVERAMLEHPRVGQACVTGYREADGVSGLCGYYAAGSGGAGSGGLGSGAAGSGLELWPSLAEFFVYDALLYGAMAGHRERNDRYRAAFAKVLAGRTVVEIGPGPEAILARLCLEAGARRVYCIELLRETAGQAQRTVRALGLADRIVVLHGDVRTVTLPEPVDYCVSEIVGSIGGAEGAALLINAARRLLRDGRNMIPARAETRLAAVSVSEGLELAFPETAAHYVEQVFAQKGYRFDLRLCLKHAARRHLLSTEAVLEDLDFTREVAPEAAHAVALRFTRSGVLHGLLAWLVLHTDAAEALDTLDSQDSWLPVFLPVSLAGLAVSAGDVFRGRVERRLSSNGLNPDYRVHGVLERRDAPAVPIDCVSRHDAAVFRGSEFYRALFAGEAVPVARPPEPAELRAYLAQRLPRYMVPGRLVRLPRLAVTASGKVDRAALGAAGAGAARDATGVGGASSSAVAAAAFGTDSGVAFGMASGAGASGTVASGTDSGVAASGAVASGADSGMVASGAASLGALAASGSPRDAVEAAVAAIWREVLEVEHVGIRENFFDAGGHSLRLVQVHQKLEARFGGCVTPVELFQFPTIEAIAELIGRRAGSAVAAAAEPADPRWDAAAVAAESTDPAQDGPETAGLGRDAGATAVQRQDAGVSGRDAGAAPISTTDAVAAAVRAADAAATMARAPDSAAAPVPQTSPAAAGLPIAIIGMSGRFPGAPDIRTFWENLCGGVESVRFFSDRELRQAGVQPDLLARPDYVRAKPVLDDVEGFDAGFFAMTPREAEITDPQHRLFLETAWNTLEDAGYAPSYPGRIGVFAGCGTNSYLFRQLLPNFERLRALGDYPLLIGNDDAYLATRVAYKLNLRGPAVSIGTACSTSLVAVDLACQSLHAGRADMALAGGVSLKVPQVEGYLFQPGGVLSPDGHCRPFDAEAGGTIGGNGVAAVLLKLLDRALADGDHIYAVIRASATNNDGSAKVGFTAPSVEGQAAVIRSCLDAAGIDPGSIGYVEAHGTGTPLGDPVEIAALSQAFGAAGQCAAGGIAIGSVKGNLGHLDAAAGITGLIKATLTLVHGRIPPSLHFSTPNPQIDFANGPFRVNAALSEWPAGTHPRRAGVSSFGIGGTNAHVLLEEAPPHQPDVTAPALVEQAPSRQPDVPASALLVLSAKSPAALDARAADLAGYLRARPDAAETDLADVAFTLQTGRAALEHRRSLVCGDAAGAVRQLETAGFAAIHAGSAAMHADLTAGHAGLAAGSPPRVAFLFPGQGSLRAGTGGALYRRDPTFRDLVDDCCGRLRGHVEVDPRAVLCPAQDQADEADRLLGRTSVAQPALFVLEYALARLLQGHGIQPAAMLGHSLGEYVAACLAGVFAPRDALALVAERGRLMEAMSPGAMLAVALDEAELAGLLDPALDLAGINGPGQCVVSGPSDAVATFEARLSGKGIVTHRLPMPYAFHGRGAEQVLAAFAARVAEARPQVPQVPYLSNLTGTWITAAEAADPAYYARHLRNTVRFHDGLSALLQDPGVVLVELGPGATLSRLAQRHPAAAGRVILPALGVDAPSRGAMGSGTLGSGELRSDAPSSGAMGSGTLGSGELRSDAASRGALGSGTLGSGELRSDAPSRGALGSDAQGRGSGALGTYDRATEDAQVLRALGRLWVAGVPVDFMPLHRGRQPRRVALPGYRFEHVRHWIDVPGKVAAVPVAQRRPEERPDVADWFHLPSWRSVPAAPAAEIPACGRWLVSSDGNWLGEALTALLRARGDEVRPLPRGATQDDYARLLDRAGDPDRVLNLVDTSALPGPDADPAEATARGYGSLLALARALDSRACTTLHMTVIADHLLDVAGESPVMPEKAMLLGPLKVLPQEYPGLACRAIDVIPPETPRARDALARRVLHELDAGRGEPLVALRNRHRWVPGYRAVRPSEIPEGPGIRAGGVYLVTGGLGGVGLLVAQILAEAGAKLVLASRSGTAGRPPETLAALANIEATAGSVDIAVADVADAEAMAAIVRRTQRRFGPINGVVHAAGETREGTVSMPLGEIGPRQTAVALHARAQGLRVLDQVLAEQPIEFALAISSNAAVLGGLGFGAYAAACHCMEALATGAGARLPWISANWDRWPTLRAARTYTETRTSIDRYAFSRAEAAEVLGWLTRRAWRGQVVISAGDLSARLARWVERPLTTEQRSASVAATSSSAPDGIGRALIAGNAGTAPAPGGTGPGDTGPGYTGPGYTGPGDTGPGDTGSESVFGDKVAAPAPGDKAAAPAPGDKAAAPMSGDKATVPLSGDRTEEGLIALFRDLIGTREIGPHDNFFELGGDSLVGIQLIARAGQAFGVRLPVESLFENPTVAALADCVRTLRRALPAPAGAPALVLSDGGEEGEI